MGRSQARPAPEAGDADPTHGSSDSQAFLQSEIGGLRGTSRLVHKTSACPPINYNFPGFAEMLDLLVFPMLFQGSWTATAVLILDGMREVLAKSCFPNGF